MSSLNVLYDFNLKKVVECYHWFLQQSTSPIARHTLVSKEEENIGSVLDPGKAY
jgi:hypothetical protein